MHAQHGMHINYIVEAAFGNFQPINAVLIGGGRCVPRSSEELVAASHRAGACPRVSRGARYA